MRSSYHSDRAIYRGRIPARLTAMILRLAFTRDRRWVSAHFGYR